MSGFWIFILGMMAGAAFMIFAAVKLAGRKHKTTPTDTKLDPLAILAEKMLVISHNDDEPRAAKIAAKALKEAGLDV